MPPPVLLQGSGGTATRSRGRAPCLTPVRVLYLTPSVGKVRPCLCLHSKGEGGQGGLHEMMLMKLSCLLGIVSPEEGASRTGKPQTGNAAATRYHVTLVIINVPGLEAILSQAFQCVV